MTRQQAPKGAKPSDRPFNDPPLVVDAQPAAVVERPIDAPAAVGADEPNAASEQAGAERVAVIPAIAHEAAR